jgi:hypothetical protein
LGCGGIVGMSSAVAVAKSWVSVSGVVISGGHRARMTAGSAFTDQFDAGKLERRHDFFSGCRTRRGG